MKNIEAENKYREAWLEYQKTPTTELEDLMDMLQSQITNNPLDPRWIEFKRSLPGFEDYWRGISAKVLADLISKHPELRDQDDCL